MSYSVDTNSFQAATRDESDVEATAIDMTIRECKQVLTYIIGTTNTDNNNAEITTHRFELDLEPSDDIEAVIKDLDEQMQAMYGSICMRVD